MTLAEQVDVAKILTTEVPTDGAEVVAILAGSPDGAEPRFPLPKKKVAISATTAIPISIFLFIVFNQ